MTETTDNPVTLDNETGGVLNGVKRIHLHNRRAVRRELTRVYREMRFKEIEAEFGCKLVYALQVILKCDQLDFEDRLAALERAAEEQYGTGKALAAP